MEDWQLDNACYEAGKCSCGTDDLLSEIEELLASGEITLDEAIQMHDDYFTTKERRMKPTNLLNVIITDKHTEAEKKLLYKATINALTSAVASNLLLHIAQSRRNVDSSIEPSRQ